MGVFGKQVADAAGREGDTKEKNSIIRYEPAGRRAANNGGGIEQMLHVGVGRRRGRRSRTLDAAIPATRISDSFRNAYGELPKYSTPCPIIYPVTQAGRTFQLRSNTKKVRQQSTEAGRTEKLPTFQSLSS